MIDQLTTLVRQLTVSQRIGIVFGALFSVLLLVGLVMWAGTPQMIPAFTDLSTADAEVVTTALDGAGIPFELDGAGATVRVPSALVGEARIAAGAGGYAGETVPGWSMFDEVGIGASEFDQQVAYQRALQGDITQKIEALEGVQEASVTVVAADDGILTSQDTAASASVYLRMSGGRTPDDALVQAVASMTAAAVKGLTPQAVTIVDASGVVLWGPNNASSTALTIQGTVERDVASKVQGYLASILGTGKSAVAVTADLDLDQVAKTVTSYEAGDGNPAVSAQVDREVVGEGAAEGSGGLAGTVSNVTGLIQYPNASPGASPGASVAPDYVKESATLNFANTQTVAQIVQAPGAVQRLSVAVLVDQEALAASGMSNEVLTAGIKAAVGAQTLEDFPDGRGDVIQLSPARFAVVDQAALDAGPDITAIVGDVVPTVGGGLLAVVLLLLVWRNMRALRGRAEDMQLLAARMGQPQLGPGEMAMAGTAGGYREAELAEFAPVNGPQARVQERIRLMAEDKPDELANLVTTWLHEDEKVRRR